MYTYANSKKYPIQFVNAFDKLKEQRRKLCGIQEIDKLLNFSDRKNICIVSNESKNNFLCSFIVHFCVGYCFIYDIEKENKNKRRTILIDAGNGALLHDSKNS